MDIESRTARKLLAFLEKRPGFEIQQINGQRRYGRPVESAGPSPPKGSEVFVGKLPRDMFEDEIVPLFETNGEIHEVRMMMDFSGTNRGFCFVKFAKPSQAERSVKVLNDFEIRPGKTIGVVKSVDNCRLFFGGLPKDKTEDDLYKELIKHVNDVTDVIMYKSVEDKSKNRGFAFVEFRNHRAAAMARRKLVPNRIMFWGEYLQIDWAVPEPEIDEETMSTVKILFVRNVLLSTSEEMIRNAMNVASPGSVTRVKKMKDFAFVHFSTREAAERAMNHWNGKEIDGSCVEITWAKPIQRNVRCGKGSDNDIAPENYFQQQLNTYNGQGNLPQNHWTYESQCLALLPPPVVTGFEPQTSNANLFQYSQEQPEADSAGPIVSPQTARIQAENLAMLHFLTQNQTTFYTNEYAQALFAPSLVMPQGATADVSYPYALPISQTGGYMPPSSNAFNNLRNKFRQLGWSMCGFNASTDHVMESSNHVIPLPNSARPTCCLKYCRSVSLGRGIT